MARLPPTGSRLDASFPRSTTINVALKPDDAITDLTWNQPQRIISAPEEPEFHRSHFQDPIVATIGDVEKSVRPYGHAVGLGKLGSLGEGRPGPMPPFGPCRPSS